jgi:hypothetical protein
MRKNPLIPNERNFNAYKISQDWIKHLCFTSLLTVRLIFMIDKTATIRSEVFTDFGWFITFLLLAA